MIEGSDTLTVQGFAEWVCSDKVTKACTNVDPSSLRKPVFFMDNVAQDSSSITMGYGPSMTETPPSNYVGRIKDEPPRDAEESQSYD